MAKLVKWYNYFRQESPVSCVPLSVMNAMYHLWVEIPDYIDERYLMWVCRTWSDGTQFGWLAELIKSDDYLNKVLEIVDFSDTSFINRLKNDPNYKNDSETMQLVKSLSVARIKRPYTDIESYIDQGYVCIVNSKGHAYLAIWYDKEDMFFLDSQFWSTLKKKLKFQRGWQEEWCFLLPIRKRVWA